MKKLFSLLLVLVLSLTVAFALCACVPKNPDNGDGNGDGGDDKPAFVDYVAKTKLNESANRAKTSATVKMFIDGDTTHFNVDSQHASQFSETDGVLKARYLGVDTPESTGNIEVWGKQASNFTKEKLSSAKAIILESNTDHWNADSTGERFLVWVWYQPAEGGDYRLLNLELLQNGLAKIKNIDASAYENEFSNAHTQARTHELKLFGDEVDPLFYYNNAKQITLKELRLNAANYDGQKVAFDAMVVYHDFDSRALYVQQYEESDDLHYGIYIFYGYNLTLGLSELEPGNVIHFVGKVTQFGGSWQLSDIKYDPYATGDDAIDFFQVIKNGTEADVNYELITGAQFYADCTVLGRDDEGEPVDVTKKFYELALGTGIEMKNLKVIDVYTTNKEGSASKGAMTLTCQTEDGKTIDIRTGVLHVDDNVYKPLLQESDLLGKTIDIKGFLEYFKMDGQPESYQIKVLRAADIVIH